MSVSDIKTFACSICGGSIPDRELEKLVKFRNLADKIQIICPECLSKEVKAEKREALKRSLVVYSSGCDLSNLLSGVKDAAK